MQNKLFGLFQYIIFLSSLKFQFQEIVFLIGLDLTKLDTSTDVDTDNESCFRDTDSSHT